MINLHESMGPGRDRTRDPWICSQIRICSQTRYRLRYAARSFLHVTHRLDLMYMPTIYYQNRVFKLLCLRTDGGQADRYNPEPCRSGDKKSADDNKSMKNYPACKDIRHQKGLILHVHHLPAFSKNTKIFHEMLSASMVIGTTADITPFEFLFFHAQLDNADC